MTTMRGKPLRGAIASVCTKLIRSATEREEYSLFGGGSVVSDIFVIFPHPRAKQPFLRVKL